MRIASQHTDSEDNALFISVADGVSRALLQIARAAEVTGDLKPKARQAQLQAIRDVSQASLQLLEGYALTLRLQQGIDRLDIAPLSIRSLLRDTAQLLQPYANQFDIQVELDVSPKLAPILSDKKVLQTALVALGQVFIAAHGETEERGVVRLAAHKSRYGIVVGLYGKGIEMSNTALRRARTLSGKAFQPYGEFTSGAASGVFVADSLLGALPARLHAARYHNASGLAATLPICQQLELV